MIKVRGTRVGSDGTGYYQGSNGKQYYGNPQNGYLRESLEQQKKDQQEQAALQQEYEEKSRRMAERDAFRARRKAEENSPGAIQARRDSNLVSTVVVAAMMALIAYVAVCFLVLETVAVTWPALLEQLLLEYRWGQADLGTVFRTVNAAGLIGLFVLDLRMVADGQSCVKQYVALAIALTVVTGAAGDLAGGQFHLLDLIFHAFRGLQLAVLPMLILYRTEYRRDGGRRFLRHLAQSLCGRLPGCGKVFKILGAATCVFAVLSVLLLRGTSPLSQIAAAFIALMVCGLIGLYIGKVSGE